jgi:hypothetical protein
MRELLRPQLTETQVGYLAGIIDGEGYIGLPKSSGKAYLLRVVVTSGCAELVNWILTTTGLGKIKSYDLSHRRRQTSYQWRVFGAEAGVLLKAVVPYLIVKKGQAIFALRYQENTALCGDVRLAFAKQCSESIKFLNSKQAWRQNVGGAALVRPRSAQT